MAIPQSFFPYPVSPNPSAVGQKTYGIVLSPKGNNHIVGLVSPRTKILSNVIYAIINLDNGKKYFGSVSTSERGNNVGNRLSGYKHEWKAGKVRHEDHKRNRYITNAVLKVIRECEQRALDEIGDNSEIMMSWQVVDILAPTATESEMHKAEADWQDRYHTRDPRYGYNHSDPRTELPRVDRKRKTKDKDYAYRPGSSSLKTKDRGVKGPRREGLSDITNLSTETSEPQKSTSKDRFPLEEFASFDLELSPLNFD